MQTVQYGEKKEPSKDHLTEKKDRELSKDLFVKSIIFFNQRKGQGAWQEWCLTIKIMHQLNIQSTSYPVATHTE